MTKQQFDTTKWHKSMKIKVAGKDEQLFLSSINFEHRVVLLEGKNKFSDWYFYYDLEIIEI